MSVLSEGVPVPVAQLEPVSGLPVAFGKLPAVVVFLRDLHGTSARVAIGRFEVVRQKLGAAGIQAAIVTRTSLEYARDYVPRHHVLIPLVADVDGDIRKQFGLGTDPVYTGSLLALRPSTLRSWFEGWGLGRDPAVPNGDLGGEFVVDRTGRVVYSRGFKGALDLPDIDKLVDIVMR
ncbi:MAG: redoxin domain-containing protein [Myxococcales bacterium]|nr:redoxin domain-containing protein [Myxococcales bacterium]